MNLNGVKEKILRYAKKIIKYVLIKMIIPTLLVVILIAGICYYLNIDDGVKKKGDKTNASYVVSEYTGSVSIDSNGQLVSSMTAQELWDSMKENKNRALNYLSTSDELLKLMNAELVTQYLDTRNNPDEEIDWESINDVNSKNIQGIVKLKRADSDGNNYTMTYVDPETFQRYIDKYNSSGSEEDRNIALSHFTLSSMTTSGYDDQLATKIEEGDTIKIPSGFGSVHTYMGWQKITSVTSTQYKLREQAGMNFDSEGFGRINGRYVIACTTTYGNVGDYVDFYQEDGTIIPCIIGDIKNQNDAGCNKWGHENGHCIIEFVVNKDTWYNSGHANPGTQNCHPEWNKNLTKAVNGGSYFKNPNFGTETVTEKNAGIQDSEESENSQDLMKWPTDGTNITSEFGLRSQPTQGASTNHRGIDIGVPVGTNVYACESGKVTIASESQTAGNWVVIDHGNGYVSKYMHNSELKVSVGDQVEKGQVIALSGNTGISTGPHLHFQIEYQESPIDPMSFKYDNDMGTGSSGVGSGQSSDTATKYYAKVATWSETSTTIESNDPDVSSSKTNTYTMSSKDINYQDFLNGYKMPFEYLWALLVIGEDKDFVFDLADLVYGSDIEITVHDNLTINIDTEVNTYTKMKKTITDATVSVYYDNGMGPSASSSQSENWSDEEPTPCKVTETIIRKDNTLDISLTKADIWIAEYLQEYTYEKGDRTTVGENTEKLSNDDYPDINSPNFTTQGIDTYGHAQNLLNSKKKEYEENYERVSGSVNSVKERIYNATVDKEKYTKNEVETKMYISSPGKTMEKTEPNSEKDNFVTILLKKEHIGAKNKIIEVSSWLFEILETNESTADMLDLTKYLLYKATGKDYGVTEYDFSEYEPGELYDIGIGIGGASYESLNLTESDLEILCKITSAERGDGTQEQQEYVVSVILNRVLSSRFPNTVHGVVFAPMQFQPTRNGAYDAAKPSQTTKNAVNNVVKNGDKSQGAVYFMTPSAAKGQQSWLKDCIYLFNDQDESLKDTDTNGSHNFYTTKEDQKELKSYQASTSSSAPTTGSKSEKLAYLFPKGIPTTKQQVESYLVTVQVPITTKSGKKTTTNVTIHKSLAQDLKNVLQKAQDNGFRVYEIGGYSWRNIEHTSTLSQHSLGAAVDINVNENYCVYPNGSIDAGSFWKPGVNQYSIPKDGVLVKAFKSIGWGWGGDWNSKKDYMHFSYTGG